MADVVPPDVRSRMMSGIRGRDTKPELIVRKSIHAAGFRYRLHDRKLPGSPDMVLPRYKAVLFIHGCFWHGHNCHLFRLPSTRTEFWRLKIDRNMVRDEAVLQKLNNTGWRIGIIWECAIKGKKKLPLTEVVRNITEWLKSENKTLEISGNDVETRISF